MGNCRLCPRECGVDRAAGGRGFCGGGDGAEIYAWTAHRGEEPPVSGTRGSGTVFFSRCTLRCIYCQNFRFSQERRGERYDAAGLAAILRELYDTGCHNWNLVSPTPWLTAIGEAVSSLKRDGISLPVVYNTSGFESVGVLSGLEGLADVYLTDLRYSRPETAAAGSGAGEYVEISRAAIKEMWRQKGRLRLDGAGIAVSGTICRLLILPGHAEETVENLRWLAENIGIGIAVSVMAQYTPAYRAAGLDPWGRRITRAEYESVRAEAEKIGFQDGWFQEYEVGDSDELAGFKIGQSARKSGGAG